MSQWRVLAGLGVEENWSQVNLRAMTRFFCNSSESRNPRLRVFQRTHFWKLWFRTQNFPSKTEERFNIAVAGFPIIHSKRLIFTFKIFHNFNLRVVSLHNINLFVCFWTPLKKFYKSKHSIVRASLNLSTAGLFAGWPERLLIHRRRFELTVRISILQSAFYLTWILCMQ